MRAVVTMGPGFIGQHLVRVSLHRSDEVAVICSSSIGLCDWLSPFEGRISPVEGDIRDAAALDRAMERCSAVFQQGSQ